MDDPIASTTQASPPYVADDKVIKDADLADIRSVQHGENDLLQAQIVDQVLAAKMALINDVSVVQCLNELSKTNGLTVCFLGHRRDWSHSSPMEAVLS